MNCREFVDFLMAYLDGTLSESEREAFAAHLEACPPCIVYLDTYRETIRLERELCDNPDDPVPDEVPRALVDAILAARQR